jgi:glycosyltransferase involved in cell wall biosynthesis
VKICVITCYKQPDYVRAKTLRAALAGIDGVDVIVVKNSTTSLGRYFQVIMRVLRTRHSENPDVYLLTFRGYEMLLPIRILTLGKPLIYDEFINPIEWVAYEHKKISPNSPLMWLLKGFYRLLLGSVNMVLTDTASHAELSARLMGMRPDKFLTVPVGTDETTFDASTLENSEKNEFTVLYYGNMLPLHGLKYVMEAAAQLSGEAVKFVIVGGSDKTADDVRKAVTNGANIEYHKWVEFERLPTLMREADLCLAGPFGGTFQSDYVITGKAFQYMAMGRPMMIGRNKESGVFHDKHDALIVRQADTEAIADSIRWAMGHRTELSGIGRAAQEFYARNYSTKTLSYILQTGLANAGLLQSRSGSDHQ